MRRSRGCYPSGVDVHTGDVTDRAAVQSAMQGVDAVIHMAALLHIVEPPPSLREVYQRINVGGTATVVEAAVREGVKRVVLFSTIAVYGDARQQILTEDVIPHPDTFYAQTKLAAEKIVARRSQIRWPAAWCSIASKCCLRIADQGKLSAAGSIACTRPFYSGWRWPQQANPNL